MVHSFTDLLQIAFIGYSDAYVSQYHARALRAFSLPVTFLLTPTFPHLKRML